MDKKQRRRLKTMLAELDNGERLRLTKRATKLRKAALRTHRPGARRPELDEFLFALVAPELGAGPDDAALQAAAAAGAEMGVVTGIVAGACTVLLGDGEVAATLPADLAAASAERPGRRRRGARRAARTTATA